MGFFKNNKGSIISDNFMLLKDVGGLKTGWAIDVSLYDDHLELKNFAVKQPITLKYSQITDVFHGYTTEIQEKEKSVIGRAVAGGVLFGGVGAVVGAMTANGKKEKKVTKLMFIISYTSSQGEERFLTFEDTRHYKGKKLSQKLKELCNIKDKEPDTITSL
jgi:hypothetical protein